MVDEPDLQQARSFVEAPGDDLVSTTRARVASYAAIGITGVMPHSVLCRRAVYSPEFAWGERISDAA